MSGFATLSPAERLIWMHGYDSDGADVDMQSSYLTVSSLPVNSLFLLPTIAVSDIWTTTDDFTFAVLLFTGQETDLRGRILRQFKVVGHLEPSPPGDAFTVVGASFSVLDDAPPSFLTVPGSLVPSLWSQFHVAKAVVSSDGTQA